MRKAKLAVAAAALSCVMVAPAVRAADGEVVAKAEANGIGETSSPVSDMAQKTMGDMMGMASMLMGDMPSPSERSSSKKANDKTADKVAMAGVPDGTSPVEAHLGQGGMPGGMCFPGKGMSGGPMMKGHGLCPLLKLEGAYALTDDQYQKLYDIKGDFFSSIVPKGMSTWNLVRKMQTQLTAGEPDNAAVRDLEKQIAAATSDLSMTVMDAVVHADQVLTPDQRKELHRQLIRH